MLTPLQNVGRLTPRMSIGSTPGSIRGARKRKRLRGAAARLLGGSGPGTPASPPLEPLKRRSSVSDSTLLSCSGSFLDTTPHNELEGEVVDSHADITSFYDKS